MRKQYVLGYEVLKNDSFESDIAYVLRGKRAAYCLCRYVNKPEYLYAVTFTGRQSAVKGYWHFTDEAGKLRAIRVKHLLLKKS